MMHYSFRLALFLPVLVACSGGTQKPIVQCPDFRNPGERAVFIVQPEYRRTPYLKEKFCVYASRMAAFCSVAICLPIPGLEDVPTSDAMTDKKMKAQNRQENFNQNMCFRREISQDRAAELVACLKTVTKCSQLSRCVGDLYQNDPLKRDEQIEVKLLDSDE